MNKIALGWDLHRKFSQVSVVERRSTGEIRVKERMRLEHDNRDQMTKWLRQIPQGTPVAMEGAFGWPWVADLLTHLGFDPHLGHPPSIKVLAKNEAKGDRVDADRLGRFYLRDIFPESYLSTPAERQVRERIRFRAALTQLRCRLKNRIHALLHREGVSHQFGDLFGKGGRKFLESLQLPAAQREVLTGHLQLLDRVVEQIHAVEAWMEANLSQDEVVRRLQTIPGVGLVLAHVIRAEMAQIERFGSRRRLTSYAGLAPLADESADRRGKRHLAMACNHALRWAFVEAAAGALHAKRCPPKWRALHRRLLKQGVARNAARIAVARELCELTFVLWKKGEDYRETPSAS